MSRSPFNMKASYSSNHLQSPHNHPLSYLHLVTSPYSPPAGPTIRWSCSTSGWSKIFGLFQPTDVRNGTEVNFTTLQRDNTSFSYKGWILRTKDNFNHQRQTRPFWSLWNSLNPSCLQGSSDPSLTDIGGQRNCLFYFKDHLVLVLNSLLTYILNSCTDVKEEKKKKNQNRPTNVHEK